MSETVLVVESDAHVSTRLAARGYNARVAQVPDAAIADVRSGGPALVILDMELPDADGLRLCQRLRDCTDVPIIAVSVDGESDTEIAALDSGADDYLVKPLEIDRLVARVRAALRRRAANPDLPRLVVGDFEIDFHDRRVRVNGDTIRLTPKEFDLFVYMARHPNRVLTHQTMLRAVWGDGAEEQSEYLRVFVGQLRKKLEPVPSEPCYLVTEPWVGYRFNPARLASAACA